MWRGGSDRRQIAGMPTYEYACPNGHSFEVFQKMSDPPLAPCPECGEGASRRISGGAGLLKGGTSSGEPPHAPPDLSRRE